MRTNFFLINLLFLTLAGCSTASQPKTAVTVNVNEFAYTPSEIMMSVGQAVTLTVNNTGAIEHDFVIEHLEASDIQGNMDSHDGHMANDMGEMNYDLHVSVLPGETTVLEFTPTKAGTYEFFCTVPGHIDAGMTGTLVVKNSQQ